MAPRASGSRPRIEATRSCLLVLTLILAPVEEEEEEEEEEGVSKNI